MRERDRLERELRASEDRYRTLASSSPDIVFATDAEGRYTFLSDRAATMLGWDLERTARPAVLRVRGAGLEERRRRRATRPSSPTRRPVHSVRIDFLDGDGAARSSSRSTSLGKVEDGELVGINGVARDISERERLERELSQSEERYRFLVAELARTSSSRPTPRASSRSCPTRSSGMTGSPVGGAHRPALLGARRPDDAAGRRRPLGRRSSPTRTASSPGRAGPARAATAGACRSTSARSAITDDGAFAGIQARRAT